MTDRAAELLAVARAAKAAHKYHAALDLYRRLREIETDNVDVLLAIVEVAARVGDTDEVLEARVELINHYVCANELATAEAIVGEVLELDPGHELATRVRDFLEQRKNPALAFAPTPTPSISVPANVPRGTVDFTGGIPASVTEDQPLPQPRDPFSDEKTRQAPADVMRALRLEYRLRRGITEYPMIDDEWAARTTAVINADNLRKVLRRVAVTRVMTDPDHGEFSAPNPTVALSSEDPSVAFANLRGASPLLSALSPGSCRQLFESSEVVHCFAEQLVMEQNAPGSNLFFVLAGAAVLERRVFRSEATMLEPVSAGEFFGEGALIGGSPRIAGARLSEDSVLLEIDRPILRTLSTKDPTLLPILGRCLRARLIEAFINESPITRGMSPAAIEALSLVVYLQKIRPGQTVAQRDEPYTGFSTVMAGALRASDASVPLLGPGSHFGSGSLASEKAPHTLTALTPTWMLHIPTPNLRRLRSEF